VAQKPFFRFSFPSVFIPFMLILTKDFKEIGIAPQIPSKFFTERGIGG
jgi:hypothetical protein